MEKIRLKKCPFCGGEAILRHEHWRVDMQFDYDHDLYWVECICCKAKGSEIQVRNARYRKSMNVELGDAERKAIKAWNRREGE